MMRGHIIRALTFTCFVVAVIGVLTWLAQYDVPLWYDFAAIFVLMILWKLADDRLGVGTGRGE